MVFWRPTSSAGQRETQLLVSVVVVVVFALVIVDDDAVKAVIYRKLVLERGL